MDARLMLCKCEYLKYWPQKHLHRQKITRM